jgi:membrane-associated phospholipid phosphatase
MEDLKHYPSDVVAGAAIGWVIGRTVARDDDGARRRDDGAWRVAPAGAGLVVARRF